LLRALIVKASMRRSRSRGGDLVGLVEGQLSLPEDFHDGAVVEIEIAADPILAALEDELVATSVTSR
jgi:hypothetical protein